MTPTTIPQGKQWAQLYAGGNNMVMEWLLSASSNLMRCYTLYKRFTMLGAKLKHKTEHQQMWFLVNICTCPHYRSIHSWPTPREYTSIQIRNVLFYTLAVVLLIVVETWLRWQVLFVYITFDTSKPLLTLWLFLGDLWCKMSNYLSINSGTTNDPT